MDVVDAVVVGQGFAGTAVAWHLLRAGRSVVVVDREPGDTASRVAAGLVTPVTGRRLAPTPDFAELWATADAFYRRVEAEVGEELVERAGAVRLFTDAAEQARRPADVLSLPDGIAAPLGGFAMPTAARLRAEPYLAASRRHFQRLGAYRAADLDPASLEPTAAGVRLPPLDLVARRVIFCQGSAGAGNPWFPGVPLRADAGEVLTVSVPGLVETRTVHRGVWLAPAGGGRFRVGATYARGVPGAVPTDAGRAELLARLGEFLRLPVTVEGHRAASRPTTPDHRPQVLANGQVWWLNGLGSKGALTAPALAGRLVTAAGLAPG